jgi:predicted metalloprotease with PDZ domain
MNEHYAKEGKYFADSAGVQDAAEKLTGADLRSFFGDYVSGVREIPWNDFLSYVGLRVVHTEVAMVNPGFQATQEFDQPPIVVQVAPGSGAEHAGLRPGDIILAINGAPAGREFETQIDALGPGNLLRLQITRGGAQRELQWTLGSSQRTVYQLQDVPAVRAEQKHHRALWLFDGAATAQ